MNDVTIDELEAFVASAAEDDALLGDMVRSQTHF